MQDFKGRTAFITGGASGMGLGMAHAFGKAGMNIMLADITPHRLNEALAGLTAAGIVADAICLDVADRTAMANAAARTIERFGEVHVVIANAGVGIMGRVRDASYEDWDWSNGVNFGGVVNAIQEFLPLLRRQGRGHFVANASMAGLTPVAHGGLYSVQKAAVVAMSEALYTEVAGEGIGVSVICPGMVRTNIHETTALRPGNLPQSARPAAPPLKLPVDPTLFMDPMEVGDRVLRGVQSKDLYILTHNEFAPAIAERFEPILSAMADSPMAGPPPGFEGPPPGGAPSSAPDGPPRGAGGVSGAAPPPGFSVYGRVLSARQAAGA